jgi:hypothetical protein
MPNWPRPVTYLVLRYAHLLGVTHLGAERIGIWPADLRARQIRNRDLSVLAELLRQMAVFYDGLVVPGALLLLGSGTWLTITVYGGWPWTPCSRTPGRSSWWAAWWRSPSPPPSRC